MKNAELFVGIILLTGLAGEAQAQIVLDGSLGPRGSLAGPQYVIDAAVGQIRGSNLFHSFDQFKVRPAESATFTGPDGVRNILGRVTGTEASSIDGLLRSTIPGANLFLFNPRGVAFGHGAELDVSGSVHVSTADFVRLADGGIFHADLAKASVLTVAPPSSFGFLAAPAPLSVRGGVLQVPPGQSLSFVGGDIRITEGAALIAPSGRISLVALGAAGQVGFDPVAQSPRLLAGAAPPLGGVEISGGALVDASGDPGGSVVIRADHLAVTDFAVVRSVTLGGVDGTTPAIDIGVTGEVLVDDATLATAAFGAGRAGDIVASVGRLTVTDGGLIRSAAFGAGRGGAVTVEARDLVSISGIDSGGFQSQLFSSSAGPGPAGSVSITTPRLIVDAGEVKAQAFGAGRAGDIALGVDTMTLTRGASIDSSTVGSGQGGDVTIAATGQVAISGAGDTGAVSRITSFAGGAGNAGTVTIAAGSLIADAGAFIGATAGTGGGAAGAVRVDVGSLTLAGGAAIDSSTLGERAGGTITVAARDFVSISGTDSAGVGSRLSSFADAAGPGGRVSVSAPRIVIGDGGGISAFTRGQGTAGGVDVSAGSLVVTGGAFIDSGTSGSGHGGDVRVTASNAVSVIGRSQDRASRITSRSTGDGEAGSVVIGAPAVLLADGGQITASAGGEGRAGNVTLAVGTLALSGGAAIDSSTTGTGAGGTVTVRATEQVSISGRDASGVGSRLSSFTSAAGDAGRVDVSAPRMIVDDGGHVSVSTLGRGNAGDAAISVGTLALARGSFIDSASFGAGRGGAVEVTVTDGIAITGRDSLGFPAFIGSATAGTGDAGSIHLRGPAVTLADGGRITAATTGPGRAGQVALTVGALTLADAAIDSATTGDGRGGTVTVAATGPVSLTGSSSIFTDARGAGVGGDVVVGASRIDLARGASISATSADTGNAGNVTLAAGSAFVSDRGAVTTEAINADGGNIRITAPFLVHLIGSEVTATVRNGRGGGGNIIIDPEFVVLDRSHVRADAFGGPGGNIRVVADVFLASPGSSLSASSALGVPGTVDVQAPIHDVTGTLARLPAVGLQAAALLRQACAARGGAGLSSLAMAGRDGLPLAPAGLRPSPLGQLAGP